MAPDPEFGARFWLYRMRALADIFDDPALKAISALAQGVQAHAAAADATPLLCRLFVDFADTLQLMQPDSRRLAVVAGGFRSAAANFAAPPSGNPAPPPEGDVR